MSESNSIIIGCLCALIAEVLYGMSYVFTKQAAEIAGILPLLGWRFLIAFLVMSILTALKIIKINLKGKSLRPLIIVALLSPVIYFIAETLGISKTTASESGVFLACIPVASLIASTLILRKKSSRRQITGILITLAGVLFTVFAVGASSSLSVPGYAFLMIAVVSYALYCVFVERAADYSGAEITYAMLVAGAIVFMTLAIGKSVLDDSVNVLVSLPIRERGFLAAVLYQGVGCSIFAFFCSNIAIEKLGVNRMASFIGVATVVSIIAGATLLHEQFTMWQVVGAVIIIAGVYIANAKELEKH